MIGVAPKSLLIAILIGCSVLPGTAGNLSLFSGRNVRHQMRGWNGPKDISATVTAALKDDSLVIEVVVNDDRVFQSDEIGAMERGDHVVILLGFSDVKPLELILSPGQQESSRPSTSYRVVGEQAPAGPLSDGEGWRSLPSTPPTVTWTPIGYEMRLTVPLADLNIDPQATLRRWGALVGDTDLPPARRIDMIRDQENTLRNFISRCHDAGMTIDLLQRVGLGDFESRTLQAIRFQKKMKPRQQFDGLAFDFQSLFPDPEAYRASDGRQAVEQLKKAFNLWHRQYPRSRVTAQIPDWFIDKKYGVLAREIAVNSDVVVVRAAGLKQSEFEEAATRGIYLSRLTERSFWLGVPAAADKPDPESALRATSGKLAGAPQFEGFGFDDYARYRRMEKPPSSPAAGDQTARALFVEAGKGGLAEQVLSNDYFQKDFFKFCGMPFGEKERRIRHLFFNAGVYLLGHDRVEIQLAYPEKLDRTDPKSWAEFK